MSTEEATPTPNMAGDAPTEGTAPPEKVVKEMRAIVLSGFGGVKMLKTVMKPEICAGDGELKIRVKACGLNFLDLMVRQGVIENPPKTPVTMGFECAGEVEEVGDNVTDFKGDLIKLYVGTVEKQVYPISLKKAKRPKY